MRHRSIAHDPLDRSPGSTQPVLAREAGRGYRADDVGQVGTRLGEVAEALHRLGDLLPDRATGQTLAAAGCLDAETLEGWVRHLRRIEGTVATVKAAVIGLGDAVKVAEQAGLASTGQWLKDRFNTSSREANRQQQLAETLDELPRTREAVASGQLGPEQAVVLGQASRRGRLGPPEVIDDTLLDAARRSSPEQLRERIRRAEQVADGDALRRDENRQHALRRASCVKQDDGMWRLDGLLPGIDGEMVATALNAFTTPDPSGTPRHLRRRGEQRAADGLIALARAALDGRSAPQTGGLRPHLMVFVPYDGPEPWRPEFLDDARHRIERLAAGDGSGSADGTSRDVDTSPGSQLVAETAAGTALSPEATHRTLCDARITRVVLSGRSEVLDVGRTTRTWTAAQRAALVARDRRCRGPGCDRPATWCEGHHVIHWSRKGRTDRANGILLCHQHHRLVHEGGWTLTLDPTSGVATFTDPHGTSYTTAPPGVDPLGPDGTAAVGSPVAREERGRSPTRGSAANAERTSPDRAVSAADPALDRGGVEALALPLPNAPPG